MLIALYIEISITHSWQQSKALLVYFGLVSGRVRYNEVGGSTNPLAVLRL